LFSIDEPDLELDFRSSSSLELLTGEV